MTNEFIATAALHMPEADCAELAHKLILSLETQSEAEIAEQWRQVAKQRAVELDHSTIVQHKADVAPPLLGAFRIE